MGSRGPDADDYDVTASVVFCGAKDCDFSFVRDQRPNDLVLCYAEVRSYRNRSKHSKKCDQWDAWCMPRSNDWARHTRDMCD